jgi:ribosomal protein L40E
MVNKIIQARQRANRESDKIKDEMREAEKYVCADCGHEGYGAWNCLKCGKHHLIR